MTGFLAPKDPEAFVRCDYFSCFGDSRDGVLELVLESKTRRGVFSAGYYTGFDKPKNIIDISSMAGCPIRCSFCAVGAMPYIRPLNPDEMFEMANIVQERAKRFFPEGQEKQRKITLAKSGDPLLNPYLKEALEKLSSFNSSYKVSTVFPAGQTARKIFGELIQFSKAASVPVQFQVSLLSTREADRQKVAGVRVATLAEIAEGLFDWRKECAENGNFRIPNLSITLTEETVCDIEEVTHLIPPELAHLRIRPYVPTENGHKHSLRTASDQKLELLVKSFSARGYQVSLAGKPSAIEDKYQISSVSELEIYQKRRGGGEHAPF